MWWKMVDIIIDRSPLQFWFGEGEAMKAAFRTPKKPLNMWVFLDGFMTLDHRPKWDGNGWKMKKKHPGNSTWQRKRFISVDDYELNHLPIFTVGDFSTSHVTNYQRVQGRWYDVKSPEVPTITCGRKPAFEETNTISPSPKRRPCSVNPMMIYPSCKKRTMSLFQVPELLLGLPGYLALLRRLEFQFWLRGILQSLLSGPIYQQQKYRGMNLVWRPNSQSFCGGINRK